MRQRCILLDSTAEWKEALEGIPHTFAHTWEHCYAMHLTTGLMTYLYCLEEENVRIVCPISERAIGRHIDITTPNGLPGFIGNGDCPAFPRYWTNFVRQKDYVCGYIGLNPIFDHPPYYEPERPSHYNSIYILDLTLSRDELFANLDRNRKRQLKDWEEISSRFILDRRTLTDFFVNNYHDFMHRINASRTYHFSRETLSFLTSLDNVLLVGAGKPERIEAVYVFAHTPYSGDCLFNVSLPEGRHHTTALLWYGVNYLKSIQIPLLNLGGGVTENDSVAQAKQRFGSKKLPLRCLKQVYDPHTYQELCRQVEAAPTDMSGYFPAYRAPRSIGFTGQPSCE
jgi:hypothetical protein